MSLGQNNKLVLSYKLPAHFINNNENIGNKLEDFEILQIMGRGAYGYVAKVKSKKNLKIYALKKNIMENLTEIEKLKLKNELLFLKKFDHQNVCRCLTTFEENNCHYIVMKLFNNKDLYRFLEANRKLKIRIKEDTLWDIFRQCLEGLLYIHNNGVIHRDIKPGNIFMDDEGNIQIGDFGVSAVMDLKQTAKFTHNPEQKKLILFDNQKVGTENYLAPEIKNNLNYDQRADVYSMGVTFFILCYYKFPFVTWQNKIKKRVGNNIVEELQEKEESRVEEMVQDNFYSYELRNIIYKMIQKNPNMRPTSSDINYEFKKYYIKLYSKNSGLYSLIQCLFSFPNFSNYFTDENQISFLFETKYPKKISLIMISLISSLRDKKDIAENIYALRQILYEEGIREKDNKEISPIKAINLILISLNNELNTLEHRQDLTNSKGYLAIQINQGDKIKKYKEFQELYQSNFKSFISENFLGVLKIKKTCSNKHEGYSFNHFHFISFNCHLLAHNYGRNIVNVYECFNCLNRSKMSLDFNKFIVCEKCNSYSKFEESKTFYEVPNNLIIMFDRGEDNKNDLLIYFEERIKFENWNVENNIKKEYYLVGAINEIRDNNGKAKYISFIKKNNIWVCCDINNENREDVINNFKMIRETGKIISLFYFYDEQSSVKYANNNFINNNNYNCNQNINNLLKTYIYNMNKMNYLYNMNNKFMNNANNMNNMNNMNNFNNNRANMFPYMNNNMNCNNNQNILNNNNNQYYNNNFNNNNYKINVNNLNINNMNNINNNNNFNLNNSNNFNLNNNNFSPVGNNQFIYK